MAGRGGANFPHGQGGGGAGSGAPHPNTTQNPPFPRQNSQFERGSGSGFGNGRGAGGNGYSHFNQQNFNSNVNGSRGQQGFQNDQASFDRNVGAGFNGNSQYRGGDRWRQNDGWLGDNGGFDHADFGGDFGNFNEGYFDGGQGFGQNFIANSYGGTQRAQRPYRNPGQRGRGRGGRGGRGRFNGRGSGGRTPPVIPSGQESVGAGSEEQLLSVTPQVQQMVRTAAALQPAVNAQALQQVLHGIQQQNLTQVVTTGNDNVNVSNESGKSAVKKDKLADILCFKCEGTGHFAADCQAVLCIYCDSAKHAWDCSYPNLPKPTALMYGLCQDDLLFFDIPKSPGVKAKRDSGKTKEVDVAFTRAGEVVRLLVQVLNPDRIPEDTDHYFDGEGFRITFEVEGRAPPQTRTSDHDMDDAEHGTDDNSNIGNGSENAEDHIGKKPKNVAPQDTLSKTMETPQNVKNAALFSSEFPVGSFSWEDYCANMEMENNITVGCLSVPLPPLRMDTHKIYGKSFSAARYTEPKKLWGDRSESDDEGLPSPLSKIGVPSSFPVDTCTSSLLDKPVQETGLLSASSRKLKISEKMSLQASPKAAGSLPEFAAVPELPEVAGAAENLPKTTAAVEPSPRIAAAAEFLSFPTAAQGDLSCPKLLPCLSCPKLLARQRICRKPRLRLSLHPESLPRQSFFLFLLLHKEWF
ncbi:hypothetical protein ACQ4PT_034672 [Festuca glaucescens]